MTDEALHLLARVLLRVCSPRHSLAILGRVGSMLPRHRDRDAVLRAGARIRRRGTCLSRALTVAARTPDAELVIGVARPTRDGFHAHAWLEMGGQVLPLEVSDVVVSEIARLGVRGPTAATAERFTS